MLPDTEEVSAGYYLSIYLNGKHHRDDEEKVIENSVDMLYLDVSYIMNQ